MTGMNFDTKTVNGINADNSVDDEKANTKNMETNPTKESPANLDTADGPDVKRVFGTHELCFNPSPTGSQWAFIDVGKTSMTLPISIIDGEIAVALKITSCPATYEKNARAVITFPLRSELEASDSNNGFVASPGCTNEYTTAKFSDYNHEKIDSEDIVNIKLSDIPRIVERFEDYGVYFDARVLAHLAAINNVLAPRLKESITKLDYSLDEVEGKILRLAKSLPDVETEIEISGKFLEYKKATVNGGKVNYANRPSVMKDDTPDNEIHKPGVCIAMTFVKGDNGKMYMVINRENRPPIDPDYMATIQNDRQPFCIASPAGLVDSTDGNVKVTGARELTEETGMQAQYSEELGYFISSADGISETYGGVLCICNNVDTSKLDELENGDLRYTPSNTDGGVTQDVTLVQIGNSDTVNTLVSKLEKYGVPNSQSLALLFMLSKGYPDQSIYEVVNDKIPKETWFQRVKNFFFGK